MKPILIALISLIAASADAHAATATSPQARLQAMSPGSAVSCRTDAHNNASCTVGGYETELTGCSGTALYGAIAPARGADLGKQITPAANANVARLQEGQFVCIAATARNESSQRHYVVAIPTASVPGCKANDLCTGHDKPIQWTSTAPDAAEACHRIGKDGEYAGRCAAGWVDESDLDQYANGL